VLSILDELEEWERYLKAEPEIIHKLQAFEEAANEGDDKSVKPPEIARVRLCAPRWMILKRNQLAHRRELGLHLLNVEDNEHATVHELRGGMSYDLIHVLNKTEAISLFMGCVRGRSGGHFARPLGARCDGIHSKS